MSLCPRCSNNLRAETLGAIVVDGCDACGGLWFDRDELGRLASGGRDSVDRAELLFEPPGAGAPMGGGGMHCPLCAVPLYEFEFRHAPGVKLDACPQCRGVWVDDRELDAIGRRMGAPPQPAAAPRPVRQRARQATALMERFPCAKCGEANPASSLTCWVCGEALRGRRGSMLCPRCDCRLCPKAAAASDLELEVDPRVDHCEDCGGVWLGTDELSVLMDLSATWLAMWQDQLSAITRGRTPLHTHDILCPVCQVRLDERAYGADSGVYIDRCSACQGMWLDGGELVLVKQVSMQQDVWRNSL